MSVVDGLVLDVPMDKSKSYGAWVSHNQGDVHVYVMNGSVVIGTNISYKDKIEFSDIALIASDDEGLRLQFANGTEVANVTRPVCFPASVF